MGGKRLSSENHGGGARVQDDGDGGEGKQATGRVTKHTGEAITPEGSEGGC